MKRIRAASSFMLAPLKRIFIINSCFQGQHLLVYSSLFLAIEEVDRALVALPDFKSGVAG
jgi:hypothetical protein